jgi:hypothetical protein
MSHYRVNRHLARLGIQIFRRLSRNFVLHNVFGLVSYRPEEDASYTSFITLGLAGIFVYRILTEQTYPILHGPYD